jgi:hypothetical protein
MIEKPALPDLLRVRRFPISLSFRISTVIIGAYLLSEVLLQRLSPLPEVKRSKPDNKKMDVIWHDDVSAHGDIVFGVRSLGEIHQCAVDRPVRE